MTRTALHEVRQTKHFKKRKSVSGTVPPGIDVATQPAATYCAAYTEEDDVVIYVVTRQGCTARWNFTWPDLLLTKYHLVHCACRKGGELHRDHTGHYQGGMNL